MPNQLEPISTDRLAKPAGACEELPHKRVFRGMPEVWEVVSHPKYVAELERLTEAEQDRVFCRHGIPHLLDVARIAYIESLERKLPFRKAVVYAAALLHDIGKAEQYATGEPHEAAGARVAWEILQEVEGFTALEKTMIVAAVGQHRRYEADATPLGRVMYEADKASRACWACDVREDCNWSEEKMNLDVRV